MYTVATVPWKIQKKSFFNSIFHTYFKLLRYLRRKQTVIPLPTTSEKCYHIPCKMQNFFIWLKVMLRSSKRWWLWKKPVVGWHWWLWQKTSCDMWQMECQASNVTASVQSDHLVHGYMLPVFFATDQLHRPPCSAKIQPMSQQDASASCPYRELVLNIRYTRSCRMPQMQ